METRGTRSPSEEKSREPERGGFGHFLRVSGGTVFYCLSALSVIYGILMILGPQLLQSTDPLSAFFSVGALNLYELAVLGTLLFIVTAYRVMDDAITLVVLIPPFLVGSAIALVTIAYNGPNVALAIGILGALVGIGKIESLRRWVGIPMNGLSYGCLVLVILWNFLIGVILIKLSLRDFAPDFETRGWWFTNVLFVTICGLIVYGQMGRKVGFTHREDVPFLQRSPMFHLVCLLLFVGLGVHLYAVGYIFHVPTSPGDFFLIGTLCVLMLVEVLDQSNSRFTDIGAVITGIPLLAVLVGAIDGYFSSPLTLSVEVLGHPLSTLFLGAAGAIWFGIRRRRPSSIWISSAYLICAVLIAGYVPNSPESLNWEAFVATLVFFLFGAGIFLNKYPLSLLAVIIGSIRLAEFCQQRDFFQTLGISFEAGLAWILGLGFSAVSLCFRKDNLFPLSVISAGILGAAGFFSLESSLRPSDWFVVAILLLSATAFWWRFRRLSPVVILCLPILERLWRTSESVGNWWFVILGFCLLAAGGWMSSMKGRRTREHTASH
ncbi:MAG: hypothetical protein AAGJ81_13905 [Verrucomicrobiota bacterium]